jgi:PII-like signaling protein
MHVGETVSKLNIYVDEKDKHHHKPVYEAVLDILHDNNIAGASVFRGMGGYGADGVMHSAKILELSTDLPVKIEVVDSREAIEAILPELCKVVEKGLVTVSESMVIKCQA